MQRRLFLSGLAALALPLGCNKGSSSGGGNASRLRIAVIPKGTTHEFWKSVHAGAVKGSREADVDIVWKGPLKEDDLRAQIELVQSFVAQKVSGIVLAPLSDKALASPVKAAQAAGIPVVIFDSDLQSDLPVSFIATDNLRAGKIAGEEMARLLGDKGNVVVLRYQEGSASTSNREKGFLEAIRSKPGIKVLSDNQYAGATTETAFSAGENLLLAHNAAAGGINGLFAPNESSTFGLLLAVRKAGVAGKVRFIGFDASDKLVQGLKEGHLDAVVVQDPLKMGYLAVKTLAQHLRGQPIEKRLDTGATLAVKGNLESLELRELLKPDLKKWLGE